MLPRRIILFSVYFIVIILVVMVNGNRVRKRKSKYFYSKPPGQNMCKVQHVLGTKEKFFTHCLSKHLKVICERPTFTKWECCPGFKKQGRSAGCTNEKALGSLMETALDLNLNVFHAHAYATELGNKLQNSGAYTIFAPTDDSIKEAGRNTERELSPPNKNLSLLHYHVAPGRLKMSNFRGRNQEFVTLYKNEKLRVNKYAYGVSTVNCARIIRTDELATNGIIHVIDKVLKPGEMERNLAQRIFTDDRFSQFQLALFVANMVKTLKKSRGYTVLAPTNQAFAKLSSDVMDRILTDADVAEKVIKKHIVRGVFCADAIVVAIGLKTLDNSRLLFRCKRDGLMVNQANVVDSDVMAGNGVIHAIDTVLLPDSVKNAQELMEDMYLNEFLQLALKAGLNNTFNGDNITIFSPTNRAVSALPGNYLASLSKEPLRMKKLLNYHIVKGHLTENSLIGNDSLDTNAELSVKIKVNVYRNGVMLDKALLEAHSRQCSNAVIHRVDSVLIPAEQTVQDAVYHDPDTSVFSEMLEASGISESLLPGGSYTILAPTNRAFKELNQRQLTSIMNSPDRVKRFVERHIIPRMVFKCTVPKGSVYTIDSLQGDSTQLEFDHRKRLIINKHSRVVSDDVLMSNGVLYKIDHVIPCSCERALKTKRGRYILSHRYRRQYW